MRDVSSEMPPPGALTWPSSEVPVPKAMTGTRCSAQARTISCTSAVLSRERDAVRRLRRDIGRGVRVLLADRLAGLEALAEALLQDAEHGGDAVLVAFDGVQVAESHGFLRDMGQRRPLSSGYGSA